MKDIKEILSPMGAEVSIIPVMQGDGTMKVNEAELPDSLPILALRNAVLFPGTVYPITIGRDKSIRLIQDAEKSRSPFTRIYGYCVAACLFMHLFINIGMTIGLMPVIGIPLPMISYGGSSLLAFSTLIFIFLALHRQESKYF